MKLKTVRTNFNFRIFTAVYSETELREKEDFSSRACERPPVNNTIILSKLQKKYRLQTAQRKPKQKTLKSETYILRLF